MSETTAPTPAIPAPTQPQRQAAGPAGPVLQGVTHSPVLPPPPMAATFSVPQVDSSKAFGQFTTDYSKYLDYSRLSGQEIKSIQDTLDAMLARMDELGTVIDTVASENDQALQAHLPNLKLKAQQLSHLFATIDKMQGFIEQVKKTTKDLDAQVTATDAQHSTISVQKIFSFFSSKKQDEAPDNFTPCQVINPTPFFDELRRDYNAFATQQHAPT